MVDHLQDMKDELERFDKLGRAFIHFGYREKYGWTFEQFVDYVDNNTLSKALGH